jgi:hypothetical protein
MMNGQLAATYVGEFDGGCALDSTRTKITTTAATKPTEKSVPDACAGLACGDVCGGSSYGYDDDGVTFYCQGTVPVFYVGILRCCKISHACWLEVSRCVIGCHITVCLSGISFFTMSFTALQH